MRTSAYYSWRSRGNSAHQQRDQELGELIQGIYDQSRRRYGSPRMYHELRAQRVQCSEKPVARLMQQRGLTAQKPRRFITTTNSGHLLPVATHVLDRNY